MSLLNIIIPIYNVEKYLSECIESLAIQKENIDFEVLLIDDGSTDRSSVIADEYACKYSFIRTYHKLNGGLSDARNYGVENSNGEYLLFLDSDDLIEQNAIKEIVNVIVELKPDLIIGNLNYLYDNGKITLGHSQILRQKTMDSDDIISYLLTINNFTMEAVKFIVKAELLKENNIKFKKGILHEDEDFTPRVICCAEKIYIYDTPFYLYRQRAESITTTVNVKRSVDKYDISVNLYNESKQERYTSVKSYFFKYRSIMVLISALGEYNLYNGDDKKLLKKKFSKYNMILDSVDDNKKVKVARRIIKCFGINLFSIIQMKRKKVGKSI